MTRLYAPPEALSAWMVDELKGSQDDNAEVYRQSRLSVSPAYDYYSLGMTLLVLLTGERDKLSNPRFGELKQNSAVPCRGRSQRAGRRSSAGCCSPRGATAGALTKSRAGWRAKTSLLLTLAPISRLRLSVVAFIACGIGPGTDAAPARPPRGGRRRLVEPPPVNSPCSSATSSTTSGIPTSPRPSRCKT